MEDKEMAEGTIQELVEEVRGMGKVVKQLQLHSPLGPLMTIEEAAKYTGRSRRTFNREFKLGFWTSVKVGGKSHPKFSRKQLDEDMKGWTKHSRYHHKVKSRR